MKKASREAPAPMLYKIVPYGDPADQIFSVSEAPQPAGVTLTATTIPAGVQATWSGIVNPMPKDWIGIFPPGAPFDGTTATYITWVYVSGTQTPTVEIAAGSANIALYASGTYEARLYADDGATLLATSAQFTFTVTTPPIEPPPIYTGELKFVETYPMAAATNDGPTAQIPLFGKHISWSYSAFERAAYLFGGDGGSDSRNTAQSSGFHYGRISLGVDPPVFSHFYPYMGIAGKPCPAGYDCVPFCYDSKRNACWQIGGYSWDASIQPWVGVPERYGVWRFDAPVMDSPFGEWTHVSSSAPTGAAGVEGMSSIYYPRLDLVIGLDEGRIWSYGCATGSHGLVNLPSGPDYRDTGRYCAPGYDATTDELIFLAPIAGKILAAKLTNFPASVTVRAIASVPSVMDPSTHPEGWSQIGQLPSLFASKHREFILFYINFIKIVNVDTGTVTDGPPYSATGQYINSAIYAPDLDLIAGSYKDSHAVTILKWTGATSGGEVIAVGTNRLRDINPDPSGTAPYTGNGYGAIIDAWSGSAYASELGEQGSILLWNGGDGDYWGNQVSRYDFATAKWSRMTEPYSVSPWWTGYDGVRGLLAPGQPSVPHDYDCLQYIPPSAAHPLGVLAAVVRLVCQSNNSPVNSAYFDLSSKTWDVAENAVQRSTGTLGDVTAIYDQSRGRIWYRGNGNIDKVGYVDTTTLDHGHVQVPGFLGSTYATSCRDPKRDLWLSIGKIDEAGNKVFQGIDLANVAAGNRNIALTGDPLPLWDGGIDWCPPQDCAYAYFSSDPQACYRITPDTWHVKRIVMGGATIAGSSLPFSKWRWASKLGAFYLLTDVNQPVWVYRP